MKEKKFKIFITILAGFFLFFATVSHAQDKYGLGKTAGAAKLPTSVAGSTDATQLIGAMVKIALDLTGIIFFVLILLAGFRWMTARDNSDVVDKSKSTIEHAVVGLIIVLAAYAITSFIFSGLSATGASNDSNSSINASGGRNCQTELGGSCNVAANCTSGSVANTDCDLQGQVCCLPSE